MKKILLTIIGILFLTFLFLFWGGKIYTNYAINSKIEELRNSVNLSSNQIFTYSQLDDQPKLLQKFFTAVIKDSTRIPNFITLNQSGEMKTEANSEWLKMNAREVLTTSTPALLWDGKIGNSKFFWVEIIDSYLRYKGRSLVKINSSITIGDSKGIEIDKSNLFKFLSEAVFFPTSLLPSSNLYWDILDSNSAEVKFTDEQTSVVAKFFFNENGTINKIETLDKFLSKNNNFKESLYTVYFHKYKWVKDTFLIPTYFEVEWNLKKGKLKFGKFKLDNIKYE